MSTIRNFIVVDDDLWNNKICQFNIKKSLGDVTVKTFLLPEEALTFIENEFINNLQPTILFLDINMPILSGWGFLERYDDFNDDIKEAITIYMLSSSISREDEDRARANQHVKDFISKPLLHEKIQLVANSYDEKLVK